MSSYNLDRFHYNEFDRAMEHYKANEKDAADEICAFLVVKARCPRLVQIQAWQLRSMCTINYWRAKAMLEHAVDVCNALDEDRVVKEYREHTAAMLADLESIWTKRWAAEGLKPPEKESIEDTYLMDDDETEVEVTDAEMLAIEYAELNLLTQGGSPPVEGVHGGSLSQPSAATIVTDAPLPPLPPLPSSPATPSSSVFSIDGLPPLPSSATSKDSSPLAEYGVHMEVDSDESL